MPRSRRPAPSSPPSDADAKFAAGEVQRYTPLAESGAETREKLTTLRNQATQASNTAAAQHAALESAQRRIGALQAQIRQAEAQGETAQAQLSAANVNLGSTIVRASVDGRVGDKSVRVGQFVQSGTRLMSVVPLAKIYISANFKETQIGLMRPGQPATIEVDALPGVELKGHVDSVSPGTGAQFSLLPPQNATGNFTKIVQRVPVRIAIDAGPDARKRAGAGPVGDGEGRYDFGAQARCAASRIRKRPAATDERRPRLPPPRRRPCRSEPTQPRGWRWRRGRWAR